MPLSYQQIDIPQHIKNQLIDTQPIFIPDINTIICRTKIFDQLHLQLLKTTQKDNMTLIYGSVKYETDMYYFEFYNTNMQKITSFQSQK